MASFNDLDTLRQMGLVSLIYNGNHQLCLKISCAGTGITFTGSMDSVVIIAAIKQQMTVDNVGLQGMLGLNGGMMVKDYDYDFIVWSNGGLTFGVNELEPLIFVELLHLPTVSTTWLAIGGNSGNVIIVPNDDHVGYWWDDDSQSYISAVWNSSVTYGIIALYITPFAYSGRMELDIKEVSGTVGVHNVSNSSVTVCQANIAVCSSNLATVVTVYNSSNVAYNAFKYTSDGTDYYYVLDGTQTDWTDDLSSIGYHMIYTAWLKADHTIKSISEMEWYDLYDDDGWLITSGFPDPFTSHSFIVINAYRGDDVVTCTFNQFDISTGHLKVNMNVVGQSVQYITYMVSPTA